MQTGRLGGLRCHVMTDMFNGKSEDEYFEAPGHFPRVTWQKSRLNKARNLIAVEIRKILVANNSSSLFSLHAGGILTKMRCLAHNNSYLSRQFFPSVFVHDPFPSLQPPVRYAGISPNWMQSPPPCLLHVQEEFPWNFH